MDISPLEKLNQAIAALDPHHVGVTPRDESSGLAVFTANDLGSELNGRAWPWGVFGQTVETASEVWGVSPSWLHGFQHQLKIAAGYRYRAAGLMDHIVLAEFQAGIAAGKEWIAVHESRLKQPLWKTSETYQQHWAATLSQKLKEIDQRALTATRAGGSYESFRVGLQI